MTGTFIMMVGLPGSGKSTYVKEHYKDATIICPDDIRFELCGDVNNQERNVEVFNIASQRIAETLSAGVPTVVFDATNVVSKRRISFLQDIKHRLNEIGKVSIEDINIKCVVICTPFEECLKRNAERVSTNSQYERTPVPEEVLHRMIRNFQCPQYYEGFNEIEFIGNSYPPIVLDFYSLMRGFNQNTPYHKYDLLTHCVKVSEQFHPFQDARSMAGLYHDIGKLYTQTTDENGVSHYYRHENVGAYYFMCNAWAIAPKNEFLHTLFYINNHMHIRDIIKSEKAVKRYKELWGEDRFNKLVEFMNADNKASGREILDGAG